MFLILLFIHNNGSISLLNLISPERWLQELSGHSRHKSITHTSIKKITPMNSLQGQCKNSTNCEAINEIFNASIQIYKHFHQRTHDCASTSLPMGNINRYQLKHAKKIAAILRLLHLSYSWLRIDNPKDSDMARNCNTKPWLPFKGTIGGGSATLGGSDGRTLFFLYILRFAWPLSLTVLLQPLSQRPTAPNIASSQLSSNSWRPIWINPQRLTTNGSIRHKPPLLPDTYQVKDKKAGDMSSPIAEHLTLLNTKWFEETG